jgi:hypothetical protein
VRQGKNLLRHASMFEAANEIVVSEAGCDRFVVGVRVRFLTAPAYGGIERRERRFVNHQAFNDCLGWHSLYPAWSSFLTRRVETERHVAVCARKARNQRGVHGGRLR